MSDLTDLHKRLSRVSVHPETGCWLWHRKLKPPGYPQVRWKGQQQRLSRVVYEVFGGPIPSGMDVHHRCQNKSCVNPQHLVALARRRHAQEHLPKRCPRNHLMEGDNVIIVVRRSRDQIERRCRACEHLRDRARYLGMGVQELIDSMPPEDIGKWGRP